jgi:carbon monoxide dehydrogenase subunit G
MELKHAFTVPVPLEEAWRLLLDLERIVPALPGASLTSREGDAFTGRVKVKIGSIQMAYQGQGKFTERDEEAHRIVIEAVGKDTRGAGTASATISCGLVAVREETRAEVVTDLALTGKPAQFGRGLLNDVGAKIIDQFATNLSAALQATTPSKPESGTPPEQVTPRVVVPQAEPLDLMSVAGGALAKRAAGALAAVVALLVVARLVRRRQA